jgi:hypothetical protein
LKIKVEKIKGIPAPGTWPRLALARKTCKKGRARQDIKQNMPATIKWRAQNVMSQIKIYEQNHLL